MHSESPLHRSPKFRNTLFAAFFGFAAMAVSHAYLAADQAQTPVVHMGYMPVVTNLAAPLLDAATEHQKTPRFEAMKFASFAEMAAALRSGDLQVAFMVAPLAVVLHQQGADVKLVYVGNRHESAILVRKELHITSFDQLAGHTIAIPMRFAPHNLLLHRLAEERGWTDAQLRLVEINPPDMAAALASGSVDAIAVGEPFATRAAQVANAEVLLRCEEPAPGFICNVMVVRGDFATSHPDQVRMLVQGAARSGLWASSHLVEATTIAARYWNQRPELVRTALDTPHGRVVFDRFVPKADEMQQIADQMKHFGLSQTSDITGLIDDHYARQASLAGITDLASILAVPASTDVAAAIVPAQKPGTP